MKLAIIMENTRSRIIGLDKKNFFLLRENVLYFDKSGYARASAWVRRNKPETFKQYLVDQDGFFSTGIIHRVKGFLLSRGINVDILDNRVVPKMNQISFRMKCSEPDAYDDQAKCTAALMKAHQGIAQLPTGVGKTRVIKDNIQQTGVRSLVITPSTALKEQTAEYLEDCFGSDMVGVYDKRFDLKPITVTNYHSIASTDPREWKDFHLVEFDEFHNAINNTIRGFNDTHLNSFYYRHGLTATNFTASEDSSILLETVLSNTVYSMSVLDAIKKKYIVPIKPIFFDLQNANITSELDYRKDYKKFIDNNEERNYIVRDLMSKMLNQEIPSLTLVKHIEHGKALCGDSAVFINGQDANAKKNQAQVERFNNLEIPQMVGTSVIGEGVNTKACGAVINGKGGKSEKELMQNIGRTVRNFPGKDVGFYFDFIDRKQKNLLSHSRTRMRIIEKHFGIKPTIIKV